ESRRQYATIAAETRKPPHCWSREGRMSQPPMRASARARRRSARSATMRPCATAAPARATRIRRLVFGGRELNLLIAAFAAVFRRVILGLVPTVEVNIEPTGKAGDGECRDLVRDVLNYVVGPGPITVVLLCRGEDLHAQSGIIDSEEKNRPDFAVPLIRLHSSRLRRSCPTLGA